ncbi:hypothetical protein, partial [Burkholderia stabilis]
ALGLVSDDRQAELISVSLTQCRAMPIKLTHETAPYIARAIVESGSFIGGPILGDAGMNAYIDGGLYNRD